MIINTNVSSLNTQLQLNKTSRALNSAMAKLSSGSRINSAADDAAGLAISQRMTSQITGMNAAARNANDGISLIQTAEGALGSIGDILQRMRELAVQADNGTYASADKTSLKGEFDQLVSEITHISGNTQFNGIKLIDSNASTVNLHISDQASDTMTVTLQKADTTTLGVDSLDISTNASGAITALDTAINTISTSRATMGATMNRLNFTIDNLNVNSTNLSSARSRIQDADMASEMSELTKQKILSQSATAMLAQANQQPQMVLSLLQG